MYMIVRVVVLMLILIIMRSDNDIDIIPITNHIIIFKIPHEFDKSVILMVIFY